MKKLFVICISLLASFAFCFSVNAEEPSASLYLSPSSGSFLVGSTFTVSVFVNSEDSEINTVWAELRFPSDKLQVSSPVAGTSFVAQWLTPPNYSNEKGIISFKGGVPGGIKTSAGLISAITFRAVSPGKASIEFRESSKILLNDGQGTNILTKKRGGEYQILTPPPEGPAVLSPTHPNPDIWYSDNSPSFNWQQEKGVTDFSYSFDQNPAARPDSQTEGAETITAFTDIEDGLWYFHLREKKNGIWGKTSHLAVRLDTSPPETFEPEVKVVSQAEIYQAVAYFETSDDSSGVDHYQVGLIDLEASESSRAFFSEQVSPYKIPLEGSGDYRLIVQAVDRAGNIRTEEISFGPSLARRFSVWWFVFIGALLVAGLSWQAFKYRNKWRKAAKIKQDKFL